jgi:hypothetical protein
MREMRVALSIEPAFRGFWRSSVRFLWLAPKRRAPTDGRVYFILINGLMVPRGGLRGDPIIALIILPFLSAVYSFVTQCCIIVWMRISRALEGLELCLAEGFGTTEWTDVNNAEAGTSRRYRKKKDSRK